ncbi:LytTR family DNA-binding domain-containing protein [Myxococcota bacterium]|nr:LytTR family DNA-binding domain-containing protein [Myxococcota bacterium]
MKVLIFEDEPPAVAQLEHALHRWDPRAEVVGVAATVARAITLLGEHPDVDLVFADVRLADGLSLAAFDAVSVRCPVIFATAYDGYVIEALEKSAIDYVLKPIQADRVALALDKWARLRDHFRDRLSTLGAALKSDTKPTSRILARKGAAFVAVPIERVAWFTTEHKLTILVAKDGARLVVDETLAELEARLEPKLFFRLNRQVLAHVDAIAHFRTAGKGKLSVELAPPARDEQLVSQENAAAFKAWIAG